MIGRVELTEEMAELVELIDYDHYADAFDRIFQEVVKDA
jgi:hypothetical protein